MLADGGHRHIVERGHHLLREPEVFILVAHFHAGAATAASRDEGQVFGRRGADDGDHALSGDLRRLSLVHLSNPAALSRIVSRQ